MSMRWILGFLAEVVAGGILGFAGVLPYEMEYHYTRPIAFAIFVITFLAWIGSAPRPRSKS